MPAPVIAAGIGGISSIVGGALAGKPKTQTSTTTPTWSPEMTQLQDQLRGYSSSLMSDPSAGLAPVKAANTESINRRYAAMPDQISRSMAARGYGSSGNFGNSMYQSQYARAGDLSQLDNAIAQMTLSQKNQGASIAEQLMAMTRGTKSTGSTPNTSMGDTFQSAGNGMSNIATLLTLSKLMRNPGSPGSGSGETTYQGNNLPGGSPGDWGGETGDVNSGGGGSGYTYNPYGT
jgi:hypothetical protein